jgi:hypothetical protein
MEADEALLSFPVGLRMIPKHFENVEPLKPNRSNMDIFWNDCSMAITFAVATAASTPKITSRQAGFLIQKAILKLVSPVEGIWVKDNLLEHMDFPKHMGTAFANFMDEFSQAFSKKFVASFDRVFAEWKVLRQTGSVPEFKSIP